MFFIFYPSKYDSYGNNLDSLYIIYMKNENKNKMCNLQKNQLLNMKETNKTKKIHNIEHTENN